MGRSIFTNEQKEFLRARVPDFRDAQQSSTIPAFFSHLYADWFESWPLDDMAEDADDDDSVLSGDEPLSLMDRVKSVSPFFHANEDLYAHDFHRA